MADPIARLSTHLQGALRDADADAADHRRFDACLVALLAEALGRAGDPEVASALRALARGGAAMRTARARWLARRAALGGDDPDKDVGDLYWATSWALAGMTPQLIELVARELTTRRVADAPLAALLVSRCLLAARAALRRTIERAFVRALYVDHWLREREYRIEDGKKVAPLRTGVDLSEQAPRTPPRAIKPALAILRQVERLNGEPAEELFARALATEPLAHERAPTPTDFAYLVAMQSIGHGIGWDDYHPDFGLELPDAEFYF